MYILFAYHLHNQATIFWRLKLLFDNFINVDIYGRPP
jgi:hypothetical protein